MLLPILDKKKNNIGIYMKKRDEGSIDKGNGEDN
jgi:hypothetical protein